MVLSRLNPERVAEVCVQIIQAFVILKKAMMQGNLLNHCRCHTSDMLRQYPFFFTLLQNQELLFIGSVKPGFLFC